MKKRNGFLLASWIVGALYFAYIVFYFLNKLGSGTNWAENVGYGLATMLVAPHIFLVFLALVFNIIGWATSKSWAALTCGILYSVAGLMFILYCVFVAPSIILSFIGFAKLRTSSALSPHDPGPGPSGQAYALSPSLLDKLIPVDSFREKALPFVAGIVSFAVTMSTLIFLFA